MKWASRIILGIIALVGIAVGIWGLRWIIAEPVGQLAAREQILSGSTRITAYNHFFNLCAAVQGQEAAREALQAELAATTTLKEQARVRASIAGVTALRGQTIAQYNADARKDYTIGQFRDLGLPYRLPLTKEGERTSCGEF
ncbi:hypothetical protein HYZ97_02375 [Candidatus Pacearchaeota archaeon]|nr:hypothetical protein [Candidatus Pacearchaeota archaeon]